MASSEGGPGHLWRLTSTGSHGSIVSGEEGQVRFAKADAWAVGVQIRALGPYKSGFRYPANSPLRPRLRAPVSKMKMAVNFRNNVCGALSTPETGGRFCYHYYSGNSVRKAFFRP